MIRLIRDLVSILFWDERPTRVAVAKVEAVRGLAERVVSGERPPHESFEQTERILDRDEALFDVFGRGGWKR